MYLKCLEMNGFKSFAGKTTLSFLPGMTAIVGPNGCGKSNISDAIRWVLGEQSAKALRGSKMEDVIFNGTDAHKPLGLCEVSITFADAEETLPTEFNEVTVTRRVFRSGEGQYFINKTPCRLKDIQRLFMDTGIGTTSYSLMEQGRIDQILSSRPEDRRTVFEEASGIMKFKADKKEAIRKLEHTEANLLRLADVIREVKRQIGSLQRQAGKARRYKAQREELRLLDLYATRERMRALDEEIAGTESDAARLDETMRAAHAEVEDFEKGNAALRQSLTQTEREISTAAEKAVRAKGELDHTHELIRMNRQRIEEYREWLTRDSREIEDGRKQIEQQQQAFADLARRIEEAQAQQKQAEHDLADAQTAYDGRRKEIDGVRARIQALREESVETESSVSQLQNQLVEMDSRQRSAVVQRERLSAEQSQLGRVAAAYDRRESDMQAALEELQGAARESENRLNELENRKREILAELTALRETTAELESRAAADEARSQLLREGDETRTGFPAGARLLLDDSNPLDVDRTKILGALADHLTVEEAYRPALESALRSWLDAVLVADADSALAILGRITSAQRGAARLLAVAPADEFGEPATDGPGERLADHVRCDSGLNALLAHLIGSVRVVDALEQIPRPVPARAVYATRDGILVRGPRCLEYWAPDPHDANPVSRRHALAQTEKRLADAGRRVRQNREQMAGLRADADGAEKGLAEARAGFDRHARALAQKEGEHQIVSREALEAKQRLETVTWELENLDGGESNEAEREAIRAGIEETRARRDRAGSELGEQTRTLQRLEHDSADLQARVTESRVRFAELNSRAEHLASQREAAELRVKDLEAALRGRSDGIESYRFGMDKLTAEIADADGRLGSLEEAVRSHGARAESLRTNRERQAGELTEMEAALARKREELESLRNEKSALDIRLTENRMRRQSQLERAASEYSVTTDQVLSCPDPEWKDGAPGLETVETMVAELRTKIEAMGPVNLVAIEEYNEYEERHRFLTTQEEDLVKAKQQLLDMIRKINRTTSEMFQTTFNQVNTNFQNMFETLFNGGSAKLILADEEDVLECGIEIIARPPGKRLQNVSLLSGGERTLTAVALLFAIYMIKPSPFCLLDEIDAALDDANIGRFVGVLRDFLTQSQFVVITHNRQTIAASETLYGVTMPEKGISKIVSMRFSDADREPAALPG